MENVSWNDVQEFIRRLNKLESKYRYRLPTEAEWEYAARSGGKAEKYPGFSDDNSLYNYANFCDKNCQYNWKNKEQDGYKYTAPVGTYKPNGIGLYDMSGNVWEWCQDWYAGYPIIAVTDPAGPETGSDRISRGGSWLNRLTNCRTTPRFKDEPGIRSTRVGFRLLREAP
ncbi:MAG: formylglycine-generating enzyme family protein [Desulfobacterales bacterium]|nr:formylglycine-generating enzyme family protein [Desulfobacterales bacterium]